jgi:hypothetical protein
MQKIDEKNKGVIYLLLFFLLLRIGIVIIAGQKESEFADAYSYNGYAHAILKNSDWMTNPDFIGNYRPPVYPMFIAFIYAIFGINNFLAVYIFQSLISILTCFYIYTFSKKIFNEKAALFALIWSGFYIFYLKYVRELLRETWIFFLFIAFLYYIYLFLTEEIKKTRNLWLSSLFYFLLIHMDPRYLFYLPFLILPFIIYQPFRKGIKKYVTFLGLSVLLLIPWTVRNYLAYDRFVLINTRTLDLRQKVKKESISFLDHGGVGNIFNFGKIAHVAINENYPTEQERKLIKIGLNPKDRCEEEISAIKNNIYPASTFIARKWYYFIHFWKPFDFGLSYQPFPDARFNGSWSLRHNVSSIVFYGFLLPFMIFAVYDLVRKKERTWYFLTFPLIIQTLLHVIQWGKTRYRIPIDAFIIILGSYGVYLTVRQLKRYWSTKLH